VLLGGGTVNGETVRDSAGCCWVVEQLMVRLSETVQGAAGWWNSES